MNRPKTVAAVVILDNGVPRTRPALPRAGMGVEMTTTADGEHEYIAVHTEVGNPCRNCRSLFDAPLVGGVVRDGEIVQQFKCPGCQTWGDIDSDQFHGRVSVDCPNCEYHETIPLSVLAWQTPLKGPRGFVA
jgi:hypothetical protein